MHTPSWSVTIHYREPTYEEARQWGPREYEWTYVVDAPDPDAAKRVAKGEFTHMQILSSVGWARDIVSMDVVER
jgi:hypothetical protein